ncbi:hypothetical protein QYR00_18385 [Agrobacterium tumefaciens]|uniref:hypothetical protein n=2 Tax=Hyphomicrobiales TaxID=356 RepID=UPI0012D353D6|nr:hypothetical protein [Agrobacterium tumefaciens]WKL22474.1 hypothetical protein QYR00_18385 [Agrobacterium tumefaciens]
MATEGRTMVTLLQSLHSITTQRGDGLRAELLGIFTPPPTWSGVEQMRKAITCEEIDGAPGDKMKPDILSAEIVRMPLRKRS